MSIFEEKALASPPRYLRVNQIVGPNGLLPISRSCWYAWRAEGLISKGLRLGPRMVVWPESEVLALLDAEEGRYD